MNRTIRRAVVFPAALALTCPLLMMQVAPQCQSQSLLEADPSLSGTLDDPGSYEARLQSGRRLTPEEVEALVNNSDDQRITVIFINPIPQVLIDPNVPDQPLPIVALVGEVRMWSGDPAAVPPGWRLCNGAELNRADYPQLFAAIGSRYGSGDGSSTFLLPDFRNRSPMGADTFTGAAGPRTSVMGPALTHGGAATHTLALTEIPAHSHSVPAHTHTYRGTQKPGTAQEDFVPSVTNSYDIVGLESMETASGGGGATGNAGGPGGSAGVDPHNNVHPFFAINYIVFVGVE